MTINEIAKLAEVSISTVSKIINNKADNINPATRERVLKIVKEYNYTPYAAVKNTSEAKTFILGVLLKDAANSSQLLNGFMEAAQSGGYSIMLLSSQENSENELKHITTLCRHKADGVIWEPVDSHSNGHIRYFTEQNIQVSLLSPRHKQIDFTKIGYEAARLLVSYKHKRIACLTKGSDNQEDQVLEGFKRCLYDNQIPYTSDMRLAIEQENCCAQILRGDITGIVSTCYTASCLMLEQLEKYQYHIPYDISLISLSKDFPADTRFPHISSIRIPYFEFGRHLAIDLIDQCEKRAAPKQDFTFAPTLDNTRSLDIPRTHRTKKIVVVGSINIDITLNLDELPRPGETVITNKSSVSPGGKGANQGVGVAKLGNDVAVIGKVGNDYEASIIYSSLKDHHIEMQGISRDFMAATGKAYIYLQKDGESTITILTGANQNLLPTDIKANEPLFENAGYCLLQTEVPEPAIEEAAKIAKAYGAKNILKPAAARQISDSLMHYIDIFIPNEKEAQVLCPGLQTLEEKADYFLKKGAKTVIITLGEAGCYLKNQNLSQYFAAADFTTADATGAADAFISALAVYLLNGNTIEKAVRIAAYAAGFCVSRQGVIPALIDRNSLETYIKKTDPGILQP